MNAANESPRLSWASRLLAVACYIGLAPLLRLLRVGRTDVFFSHHRNQALTTLLLLFLVLLSCPIALSFEIYFVRRYPGRPPDFMIAFFPGLGIWGLLSLVGVGMAVAGSTRPVPLMARLARSQWLMRVALISNYTLLLLVVLVVAVSIHACSLARDDMVPAPVYFLFDNGGWQEVGAWPVMVSAYPVSLVAHQRWGDRSVVVAPLTQDNLAAALTHGRFVFLAGHGTDGDLLMADHSWVRPSFVREAKHGENLQFVYLSECWGGKKAAEWQEVFAPAEIVTFDRLSATMEHLWWLWIDAPSRLRGLR